LIFITPQNYTFSPNYKTKTAFSYKIQPKKTAFSYKNRPLKTAFSYKFRGEKTAFSDETRKFAFLFHKNRIFVAYQHLKF